MREDGDCRAGEVAKAEAKLDHLKNQVAAMRAVLVQLLQDVVRADKRLEDSQAARLLQANEQLVINGLELQAEAESTRGTLDEVTRSAAVDPLTKLPNRTVMLDRLHSAIASARRHQKRLAVLFLDLNNFKQLNDCFGHAAGDQVLQNVAACLTSLVRETDTVSRYGGDEFIIVLAEVAEASDAGIIADKVNAALRAASRADGSAGSQGAPVTASIGISIYPDDGDDAAALIVSADNAMYHAKRHRDGAFVFHTPTAPRLPSSMPARATSPHEQQVAEDERRHAQLVAANERLVLAALGFEALKDAADVARKLRANLLAAVEHELDDPAAPVRLAAAMAGLGSAHESILPGAVAIVERQMEHMAQTVATLLEPVQGAPLALPGARTIDVAALVCAAAEDCRAAAERRHQVLDLQLPSQPMTVHGDPVQLAHMLTRLLRNATDYTPDGGRLEMHVAPMGQQVQLLISDNGQGIEADALATVLDPFVRDPRIGMGSDSFGLGLTSVRAVVQSHGGSVVASSAGLGRGSQFTILLPIVAQMEPATSG